MKKIAVAALAMIALLGFTGCDLLGTKSDTKKETKSTVSDWKIKGSADGWAEHNLTIDELDSNQLTYVLSGLYAIDYEFVLINPAGTEIKYSSDDNVAADTDVTMGGDKNVSFTAAKSSYTVTVNITNATAPVVKLVSGADAALAVTNKVLADNLKIKGDAFSIGWTDTAGTFNSTANTVSWDVTYSSKNGTFGFSSLDNFLKGVTIDLSSLTKGGAATTAVNLLSTGDNAKLSGAPMANAVYTIIVKLDATKAVGSGKYMVSVKLKKTSTTAWAFDIPATIYPTGDLTGGWNEADTAADGKRPPVTITNKKGTFTYTAAAAGNVGFKFALAAGKGWNDLVGFAGIETTGSAVALSDDGGNIKFVAVKNKTYTVTFDFSAGYTTTGKPLVTVTQE